MKTRPRRPGTAARSTRRAVGVAGATGWRAWVMGTAVMPRSAFSREGLLASVVVLSLSTSMVFDCF